MAIGGIDNDARIDAVVTTNGGPAHLLHNETPTSNHWLPLKLVGHKSNRDEIGSQVKIMTSKGPQWVSVTTSSGYLSGNDPPVHFGLGGDSFAAKVEIRWPSGILQIFNHVPADQVLEVCEPAASSTDSVHM